MECVCTAGTIFTCSLDLLSKPFLNSASLTMAEIILTCQHPSFQLHIGDTFWQHFPCFLPDFCSFLPFLLLRPNSCGPVTFGLQALVELHMRLQENSEYKLSRALNTTCYSQKVEPADKLLHVSIFREKSQKVIFHSRKDILSALLKQSPNNQQEKEKKLETRRAAHYFLVDLRPD